MKKLVWLIFCILVISATSTYAEPVEYVKICEEYGASFMYLPGTDTCYNPTTGETRQIYQETHGILTSRKIPGTG